MKRVLKKKLSVSLCLLLTICTVLGGIPQSVLEVQAADENGFEIDENGVLTGYSGSGGDVVIPENVTSIGSNAFSGCTKLKSLTLPSKVKSIGSNAFYSCKNLKKMTIKTAKLTSKGLGKKALKGIPAKAVLRVPAGKQRAYQKLFYKKGLNRRVKIK